MSKSLRISPAVEITFEFSLLFSSVLGLQTEVPPSQSDLIKIPCVKSHSLKQRPSNKAFDNIFPKVDEGFYFQPIFFSRKVPSIKTSWRGQESRQTAWLINRQEGKRTDWQRTIKFDYQTLSPDALYLLPAIRLWCFLNEKPGGCARSGSIRERGVPARHIDVDQ